MNFAEINKILSSIIDPVEKLEFVMDLGNRLDPVPGPAVCTDIHGCASYVKICQHEDRFYGFADSALVRGVVAIILSMIKEKTPDQIKELDMRQEFAKLELNLGAGRLNGVNSMISFLENL